MTLNNIEKINYIKGFHQYFDLRLNTNISTTETVNLVIPIEQLTKEYDIEDVLSKYDNSQYAEDNDLIECTCIRVIDGDTLDVKIPQGETEEYQQKRVRLVGVNTPEINEKGYDIAKAFLKKIVEKKRLYLKVDTSNPYDKYDRLLAVLICNNKNINEVLLNEGLAEVMYIPPSDFNPYKWENITVNVQENSDDINILYPYFNADMTNVIFTPKNDPTTLYRYEVYQGVYFIRLQPFSQEIRMHLLPKAYDCSDVVLFFRDDMVENLKVQKSDDYEYYPEKENINSYYLVNDEIRDRTDPDISLQSYNVDNWPDTYCDFSYNVSKNTRNLDKIEICAGYQYNNSSPYYSVHYTGVRDNTNISTEDRCTLIDANYDNIEDIANNITQYHYDSQKQLYIPKKPRDIKTPNTYEDIDHITDIEKIHHKKLKYINDVLYSEEDILNTSQGKKRYTVANWEDISEKD